VTGLGLFILIGIPTFVPALHEFFHYHRHLHCTSSATDVHLHADIYECHLCDYLTTFTFLCESSPAPFTESTDITTTLSETHAPVVLSYFRQSHLRGPPTEFV
jgi:hypothetical protein